MPNKKKYRQYSVEYLKFGFSESILNKTKPYCLICNKEFSNEAMKPSRLIDHLRKAHPGKFSKPIEYFELLKNNLFQRNTINNFFFKSYKYHNIGLKLSYKIAKFIEKTGKPHTIYYSIYLYIGEHLIKPVIKESAAELNENANNLIK